MFGSDVAEKFPGAQIIGALANDHPRSFGTNASTYLGTDLSPTFNKTPPAENLHFEIDDCCSEWVYPLNHFDYVHVRFLYASVADWPAFYKECFE